MYYTYEWLKVWVIRHKEDSDFIFGPFESEADAHLVVEMLNNDTLNFNDIGEGETNGEESIEDSDAVHEHTKKRTV